MNTDNNMDIDNDILNNNIIITYGIRGIKWVPYYDIYINNRNNKIRFILKAKIYNNTNIDIYEKNVKLVLGDSNLNNNENNNYKQKSYLKAETYSNTTDTRNFNGNSENIENINYKMIYKTDIKELYKNSINNYILYNTNYINYNTIYQYNLNNETDIENNIYIYAIGKNDSNNILPQGKYNIYDNQRTDILLDTGLLNNISINQEFDIKLYKNDFIFGKHKINSINFDKKYCNQNNNFDLSKFDIPFDISDLSNLNTDNLNCENLYFNIISFDINIINNLYNDNYINDDINDNINNNIIRFIYNIYNYRHISIYPNNIIYDIYNNSNIRFYFKLDQKYNNNFKFYLLIVK
jgi:hypothetical protein